MISQSGEQSNESLAMPRHYGQIHQTCNMIHIANSAAGEVVAANPDRTAIILSVDATGPVYLQWGDLDMVAIGAASRINAYPFFNGNFLRVEGSLARHRLQCYNGSGGNIKVGVISEFGHATSYPHRNNVGGETANA